MSKQMLDSGFPRNLWGHHFNILIKMACTLFHKQWKTIWGRSFHLLFTQMSWLSLILVSCLCWFWVAPRLHLCVQFPFSAPDHCKGTVWLHELLLFYLIFATVRLEIQCLILILILIDFNIHHHFPPCYWLLVFL